MQVCGMGKQITETALYYAAKENGLLGPSRYFLNKRMIVAKKKNIRCKAKYLPVHIYSADLLFFKLLSQWSQIELAYPRFNANDYLI